MAALTTTSDTTNYQHQQQNECNKMSKSNETDEMNEISKVKSWLIEASNHHPHCEEPFKDGSNLIEAKSENTDSAIDVNSSWYFSLI